MTVWTSLQITEGADFAARMLRRELPESYLQDLDPVPLMRELVTAYQVEAAAYHPSGAVRFFGNDVARLARRFAEDVDPDREWIFADGQERHDLRMPRLPSQSLTSRIRGTPVLGPGGRITTFTVPGRTFTDVSVRRRDRPVASRPRKANDIGSTVATMTADAPPDARLRGAFGYTEPSFYERPGLVRPVFAFLLERPSDGETPGWRVGITVPATEITDGDLPPGVDGGVGAGGCV
ncbi:MAG: hypothetical protein QOF73_403 [Thermomicrobiales bacterium]|jgi:hypothetical protein|nr:hypothetical protein [Thermomicrobiales bacterium]